MTTITITLPADVGPDSAPDYILERLDAIEQITIEQRRRALNQIDAQRAVDIETEVARIRAALQYVNV